MYPLLYIVLFCLGEEFIHGVVTKHLKFLSLLRMADTPIIKMLLNQIYNLTTNNNSPEVAYRVWAYPCIYPALVDAVVGFTLVRWAHLSVNLPFLDGTLY